MEFTPPNAPAVLLLFLFTTLLFFTGLVAAGVLAWRGKRRPARRIAEGLVVVALIYGGALLAHSFTSRDRILEPGQLKYFCEIDCHLAYSVAAVRTAKTLGSGETAATARGHFVIVSVKTWFDPRTVSPRRGNGTLSPNPRIIRVEDGTGRAYSVSPEGEKALAPAFGPEALLHRPLRPGESYTTDLVFDLPEGKESPRLLISEDIPEAPFIVSHENSLFHKKIWFRIPTPPGSDPLRQSGAEGTGPLRLASLVAF